MSINIRPVSRIKLSPIDSTSSLTVDLLPFSLVALLEPVSNSRALIFIEPNSHVSKSPEIAHTRQSTSPVSSKVRLRYSPSKDELPTFHLMISAFSDLALNATILSISPVCGYDNIMILGIGCCTPSSIKSSQSSSILFHISIELGLTFSSLSSQSEKLYQPSSSSS